MQTQPSPEPTAGQRVGEQGHGGSVMAAIVRGRARPHSILAELRWALAALVAVGASVSATTGLGTFANFSAQTTNSATFAAGTMTVTNVAGAAVSGTNCSADTNAGTCAVLFSAGTTAFKPGAADKTNTVTLTYTGSVPTGDFRIYTSAYVSRAAASSAFCTAADPAAKVNLQIKQGATVIFPTAGSGYGTLAAFAAAYTSATAGLQLKGGAGGAGAAGVWASGDASTFTVAVNLDAAADNSYQGCQSTVTLVWYAAQ